MMCLASDSISDMLLVFLLSPSALHFKCVLLLCTANGRTLGSGVHIRSSLNGRSYLLAGGSGSALIVDLLGEDGGVQTLGLMSQWVCVWRDECKLKVGMRDSEPTPPGLKLFLR